MYSKVLPEPMSHKAHGATLIFASLAVSQTPAYTTRWRIRG